MTLKISARKGLGKHVGGIVGSVDVLDVDVPAVNELANFEIAALDVTCAHA